MSMTEVRPGRALSEVGPKCELSDKARAMLHQHQAPDAYVHALRADNRSGEGLHFLAHWLPKREAIWWGCLCTWHVARPLTVEAQRTAMRAVVQWVQEPTEPRRRAVEKVMES